MCINEIVAPESIKALDLFQAWTVTMGQSKTSPIVNWWYDDCLPIHLSLHHYLKRALVV